MTNRERILAILKREKPDCVPWFGDLAYWLDYLQKDNKLPEKYMKKSTARDSVTNEGLASTLMGEGLQKLHKDLDVGFYLQGYFPFKIKYEGVKVTETIDSEYRVTVIETPFGDLKEVWKYSQQTYSWAPKEYLLKTYEDLEAYKYLYEHTYYEPDYELAEINRDSVGDNGVVLCYLPKSPFMEMVALRAGIEATTFMQLDAPELFDEVMELIEKKHDEAAVIALSSPAECLMIPENITSEVVGKTNYEKYMRRYHEKWTSRIRGAGKYSFVHLDGTMKGLISELSSAGFDVLEALTPQPVGDIAIEDLHNWVEEGTIIWGGIPGGYFSDQISDGEFDEHVIRVLEVMRKEPRYVLGVADQVVPHSSFERIKHVSELVKQYGKYEIQEDLQ
ncbi:MAG: hypothetical protein JXB33_04350 [Clostridia bacterium]|nr:hypothetical protein [Clostridia bacterium]